MNEARALGDTERLLAIEEIKSLKARYFRLMDTKQWDDYESLFADEAVCDISVAAVVLPVGSTTSPWDSPDRRPEKVLHGPQAYREYVSKALDGVRSVHHGHMPEITLVSPTEATGIWAMEDILEFPEGGRSGSVRFVHGHGHYTERYRKVNGEWKIARLAITRLREIREFVD